MPIVSNSRQFFEAQRAASVAVFEQRKDTTVDAIREDVGTPYPPASAPGEAPHKRTGNLQEGVEGIVTEDSTGVGAQVGSSRQEGDPRVPIWLEYGTKEMAPRPYMSPAKDEQGPKFKEAQADALRELSSR